MARVPFTFCLLLIVIILTSHARGGFPAQNRTDCTANEFFDPTSLQCTSCGPNRTPKEDGISCECIEGYRSLGGVACSACALGEATSLDHSACLSCGGSTTGFQDTTKECGCPSGSRLVDGTTQKECVPCPSNAIAPDIHGGDGYTCVPCSDTRMNVVDGVCHCPLDTLETEDGWCVSITDSEALDEQVDASEVAEITYDVASGRVTLTSQAIQERYKAAQIRCAAGVHQACVVLGNLCVLLFHDRESDVCKMFLNMGSTAEDSDVNGYEGWYSNLPFLYYEEDPVTLLRDTREVQQRVSFTGGGKVDRIAFQLAIYSLDGVFLGFEDLTTQLQLCAQDPAIMTTFLDVGHSYENECRVDVNALFSASEPRFYDLYLVDGANLVPVPVLLKNYREHLATVNSDGRDTNDQLTRRFFLYDTLSGIESGEEAPTVVRYPKEITLQIRLQEGDGSRLLVPLLMIRYGEVALSGDICERHVNFGVVYIRERDQTFVVAMVVVACALGLLIWSIRVATYTRKNMKVAIDGETLRFIVLSLFTATADTILLVLFFISTLVYLGFKGADNIHTLPPRGHDLDTFVALLIVAFVGKFLHIVHILYKQTFCDIFLIDWEKSRGRLMGKGNKPGKYAPISVWRMLFVGNEWNELQCERMISLELTLFWLAFIFVYLKLDYLDKSHPNTSNLSADDPAPRHEILRFCVSTFFWGLLCVIQYTYRRFLHWHFIVNPVDQFVDLCSIANISVFFLYDKFHGYYIHGHSVHEHADANMSEMVEQLRREEENLVSTRGLLPNSDLQAFEVHVTQELRQQYDRVFTSISREENMNAVPRFRSPAVEMDRDNLRPQATPDRLVESYNIMNKFLTAFIDQTQTDHRRTVQSMGAAHRFLGIPPDISTTKESVFYSDPRHSFRRLTFMGIEYHLFAFSVLLFTMCGLLWTNTIISLLVTYMVMRSLSIIKYHYGQKNIARKTLVDGRFLL